MPEPRAVTVSVVLPLMAPEPRLQANLEAWGRQLAAGDEVLLVCPGQPAQDQARGLAAGAGLRVLSQPPQGQAQAAAARAWGAAQARGEVLLFSLPDCLPAPDLLERLRQAFAQKNLAALAGALRPAPQPGAPAALASLELAWQQAGGFPPPPGCLALRRRVLQETGGLDPAWGPGGADLWEAWLRLQVAGKNLEHDPLCQVQAPQPATWGALLGRGMEQGRDIFLGRRLGAGPVLGPDRPAGQVLTLLAALALFISLWGAAPERAWSLAAICLLLLYPQNRAFILFVAQEGPPHLGPALVYCLLRPWAWTAGLLAAALAGLGGRRVGQSTISG